MIKPLSSHVQHLAMGIAEHDEQTVVPSSDELEAKAAFIVASLGNTYRDFGHACEVYNSVFFRDESKEFAQSLVSALINHFPNWPNPFWKKLVSTPTPIVSA